MSPSLLGAKYALGRGMAVVLVLALVPLLVLIALAITCTSPGPILFRQTRVGERGRRFEILKFRTMTAAPAVAPAFALASGLAPGGSEGLDRRTPVGRFLRRTSLDELPQLWNVVRGDMALVGPRPERPEFVERFSREIPGYADRHRVRAGLTGLAQVHGLRGRTPIAHRAALDNAYIDGWTLGLDARILARTVVAVLRGAE